MTDYVLTGLVKRRAELVMRVAAEPLTTREIAYQLLVERALDKSDQKLVRLMSKRVGVALRSQRDSGTVRSLEGPGQYNLWELARKKSDCGRL